MNSAQNDGRFSRGLTRLITNLIKLGGLVVALHEVLFRPELRALALAEAGFMMAGAEFSEHVIIAIIDRLVGGAHPAAQHSEGETPRS